MNAIRYYMGALYVQWDEGGPWSIYNEGTHCDQSFAEPFGRIIYRDHEEELDWAA